MKTPSKLAIAVSVSKNRKVGLAAATYVARVSCPPSCPLLHKGCYSQVGKCGIVTQRLDKCARAFKANAFDAAQAEADALDVMAVVPGIFLRGHVVGDCPDGACARIVGDAYRRFIKRGGGLAYSFTHAYSVVKREMWGKNISILASCESIKQLPSIRKQGYEAAAIIFPSLLKKTTLVDGVRLVPCQYQLRGVQCVNCGLCLQEDLLSKKQLVVAFYPDNKVSSQVCW